MWMINNVACIQVISTGRFNTRRQTLGLRRSWMVRKGSFLPTHLMPGASESSPESTGGGSLASSMTLRDTMKIVIDPTITA